MTSDVEELLIIWTRRDKDVAMNMVFMYGHNARLKSWWDRVCLMVWGPSARLLAEDGQLQDTVRTMLDDGVEVMACRRCAENFGVVEDLEKLGISVFYAGTFLTRWLQSGKSCLSV